MILNQIEETVLETKHKKGLEIDWPQISEAPMNEYGSKKIFAMAFP